MSFYYVELVEQLHLFLRDDKPLFGGTPDLVRRYPKQKTTIILDYKFGRGDVTEADVNMQLRSYLVMRPESELEFEVPYGYSAEFRPSSLLRFKLCPGSLNFQRFLAHNGVLGREPSEDAREGQRLHRAVSNPDEPRDDLRPEQVEMVEKAERMAQTFIQFCLGTDPVMPYYGGIVQPRVSNTVSAAFYTEDDIARAQEEIDGIWDAANKPDAKRFAGAEACRFCPCKLVCQEYQDWVMPIKSEASSLPVARWTDEQMDLFERKRSELQKFLNDVHAQIKLIKARHPERLPGWVLKPGDQVRRVKDLPEAWVLLQDFVTAKQFSDACSISLGEIEETIWNERRNGPNKLTQKEAKALVNVKLGSNIELKQKEPSLVQKKEGVDAG